VKCSPLYPYDCNCASPPLRHAVVTLQWEPLS